MASGNGSPTGMRTFGRIADLRPGKSFLLSIALGEPVEHEVAQFSGERAHERPAP